MDSSLPTSLKYVISNVEYYGPVLFMAGMTTSLTNSIILFAWFVRILENLKTSGILLPVAFSRTLKSRKKGTGPGKF